MRALVTGAAGFVGRHLTAHLKEKGHDVFGLVHPSEQHDGPSGIPVSAADLLDGVRGDLAALGPGFADGDLDA